MPRIAFILLCHKDPDAVIAQARGLIAAGDYVALHYDANAPAASFSRIQAALAGTPGVTFAPRRHKCGWGEWSLVAATLDTVRAAVDAFPEATHFYMLSGDCMAIKPAEYAHAFLDRNDADFIESHDFFESDWIKTGLREERLVYRHWFNERKRKWLFYRSLDAQQVLGLSRKLPSGLRIHIGSQWWCIRRDTVARILDWCRNHPDVLRFFSTTWIPDETFIQTLVRHLVRVDEIRNRTLTFLLFTDYGMPATFYNDHYDMLLAQDALFARKISPGALDLKARLELLYTQTGVQFEVTGGGERLHRFLASCGREGRRFAPRFWEAEAALPRDRTLLIVACKKWHVAKRLTEAIRGAGLLPAVDYVFDEDRSDLPDLGGIGGSLSKRHRHRRMVVSLLFQHHQADRLLLCLDPSRRDMILDFEGAPAETRVLEIDCEMDDTYLAGHARRLGLAGDGTPPDLMARLVPTIRADIRQESEALQDAALAQFHRIRERASDEENALSLARFLGIPADEAGALMPADLFAG